MLNLLSEQYDLLPKSHHYAPLDVATVAPDYYLYLFDTGENGYVVVETDYLIGMPGVIKDIEEAFPEIVVGGWCVRKECAAKYDTSLLRRHTNDDATDGSDIIKDVVTDTNGLRYAVLLVNFVDRAKSK